MNEDFSLALKKELEPGEQVVWQAQPNADAIRSSLLSYSILWLSGLFMLGAGALRTSTDDSKILSGLIVLLVIVAIAGALELVFVPRRAARTIYVLTNKRLMSLCVSKRIVNEYDNGPVEKQVLRNSKSSVGFFYLSNLPSQLMFCILAFDVVSSMLRAFDPFIAVGFALTMFGWLQPWLQDMRLPQPKFRDAPRVFYSLGEMFVFLESFTLEEITEFTYRRGREGTYNAFAISEKSGCIRMRAITEVEPLARILNKTK